jgi:hypothetical protein
MPHLSSGRSGGLTILALLLGGCQGYFTGPCPAAGVLADTDRIDLADSSGRLAYQAEMLGARSTCRYTARDAFEAELELHVAVRGLEGAGGRAVLPYFVAVTAADRQVVRREARTVAIELGAGRRTVERVRIEDIRITVAEGMTGADYEILVGFQLTPEQLARNRARRR